MVYLLKHPTGIWVHPGGTENGPLASPPCPDDHPGTRKPGYMALWVLGLCRAMFETCYTEVYGAYLYIYIHIYIYYVCGLWIVVILSSLGIPFFFGYIICIYIVHIPTNGLSTISQRVLYIVHLLTMTHMVWVYTGMLIHSQ